MNHTTSNGRVKWMIELSSLIAIVTINGEILGTEGQIDLKCERGGVLNVPCLFEILVMCKRCMKL